MHCHQNLPRCIRLQLKLPYHQGSYASPDSDSLNWLPNDPALWRGKPMDFQCHVVVRRGPMQIMDTDFPSNCDAIPCDSPRKIILWVWRMSRKFWKHGRAIHSHVIQCFVFVGKHDSHFSKGSFQSWQWFILSMKVHEHSKLHMKKCITDISYLIICLLEYHLALPVRRCYCLSRSIRDPSS